MPVSYPWYRYRLRHGGGRIAGGGGRIAAGGGRIAGGPFAAGLIAGGPFASGLNAAHRLLSTYHTVAYRWTLYVKCKRTWTASLIRQGYFKLSYSLDFTYTVLAIRLSTCHLHYKFLKAILYVCRMYYQITHVRIGSFVCSRALEGDKFMTALVDHETTHCKK